MRKRMPSTMALRLEALERDTLAVMSDQGRARWSSPPES